MEMQEPRPGGPRAAQSTRPSLRDGTGRTGCRESACVRKDAAPRAARGELRGGGATFAPRAGDGVWRYRVPWYPGYGSAAAPLAPVRFVFAQSVPEIDVAGGERRARERRTMLWGWGRWERVGVDENNGQHNFLVGFPRSSSSTIFRSWRRRKNEAIPGQGGLGDRKCWRPPAQAARAAAFCSDLQAPSPLHRAKHKKFVPAGAAAMAPVMPENHDIGWRLADGSHRSLTQLAAKFPSWVDWQMRRLPPAIANSPRSARSCPNWGVRPRASRTAHRKYQSRGKRGRIGNRGSAPRFPAGSVAVIDGPKRLWGFAEAAARTAGGFGALWEAMIERGNRVSSSRFQFFF